MLRWSPDGSQLALLVPSAPSQRDPLAHPRRRRCCASPARTRPGHARHRVDRGWALRRRGRRCAAGGSLLSSTWSTSPPAARTGSRSRSVEPLRDLVDRGEQGRPLPRVAQMGRAVGVARSPGERHARPPRGPDDDGPHAVPGWAAAPLRDERPGPRAPARRSSRSRSTAARRRGTRPRPRPTVTTTRRTPGSRDERAQGGSRMKTNADRRTGTWLVAAAVRCSSRPRARGPQRRDRRRARRARHRRRRMSHASRRRSTERARTRRSPWRCPLLRGPCTTTIPAEGSR